MQKVDQEEKTGGEEEKKEINPFESYANWLPKMI